MSQLALMSLLQQQQQQQQQSSSLAGLNSFLGGKIFQRNAISGSLQPGLNLQSYMSGMSGTVSGTNGSSPVSVSPLMSSLDQTTAGTQLVYNSLAAAAGVGVAAGGGTNLSSLSPAVTALTNNNSLAYLVSATTGKGLFINVPLHLILGFYFDPVFWKKRSQKQNSLLIGLFLYNNSKLLLRQTPQLASFLLEPKGKPLYKQNYIIFSNTSKGCF